MMIKICKNIGSPKKCDLFTDNDSPMRTSLEKNPYKSYMVFNQNTSKNLLFKCSFNSTFFLLFLSWCYFSSIFTEITSIQIQIPIKYGTRKCHVGGGSEACVH